MGDLGPDRFAEFYQAAHGYEPFPWQARLAARIATGDIPTQIDVPTGLGKTSIIDLWVYALASQAQHNARRMPLRMAFVVDRRLIVDDAYETGRELAVTLTDNLSTPGVVGDVARALQSYSGGETEPLAVVRMRGGVTWEARWLDRPDQPALIAGTVDQYGSRLLFRGYGVSASMRPINAALVGTDTWLVVDEAHIAQPLVATVTRAVKHQQRPTPTGITGRLAVTVMSATLTASTGDRFVADPDEQTSSDLYPAAAAVAAKRLNVTKPARLIDLGWLAKTKRNGWRQQSHQLGQALATVAERNARAARVIGVVANTISTARAAYNTLVENGNTAILLTGRTREFERQHNLDTWLPQLRVGRPDRDERLYVVSTQTIEVGANLDFDALVTECAPYSSLVQRFGRVNRIGDRPSHPSVIIHAGFAHDDDPIYGQSTANTWQWLRTLTRPARAATPTKLQAVRFGKPVDFGSAACASRTQPEGTTPDTPIVPVATGAHFERWAQTAPAPQPDQDVAPFLHGADKGIPEVSIAWRATPPTPPDKALDVDTWTRWLDLVAPVEWEFVSVPIWEARHFLAETPVDRPTSDLESATAATGAELDSKGEEALLGVVYQGYEQPARPITKPSTIRPGDRIVLRSDLGGHDQWGWTGERDDSHPVPDVAEYAPTRRRGIRRISWNVTRTVLDTSDQTEELKARFAALQADNPDTVADLIEALSQTNLANRYDATASWTVAATGFSGPEGDTVLLVEPADKTTPTDAISDSDAQSTSLTSSTLVPLDTHSQAVAATAARFAQHLGLNPTLVAAVKLAGRLHDAGKADIRFQSMLRDGDRLAAMAAATPLAKSGRDPRDPIARRARAIASLPQGFRHEAVSERIARQYLAQRPDPNDNIDADLVTHLIVSHHGHARPLLPPIVDPHSEAIHATIDGTTVTIGGQTRQVDWAHPARFEKLCDTYGWWGLALLETIVRLADMYCSQEGT